MTIDEATVRKRAVVERRVGCGDFEGTGDRHKHGGVGLVEVGSAAGDREAAVCGEGHANGGSAQASPPRAAAKLVARVESSRLLFCEVNLCHPSVK